MNDRDRNKRTSGKKILAREDESAESGRTGDVPLTASAGEVLLSYSGHWDSNMATEDTLYYGDNLDVLRRGLPDEAVDPSYLVPAFAE